MKISLKSIAIIVILCAVVGWLNASGVGHKIVDFIYDPGSAVPDVNVER